MDTTKTDPTPLVYKDILYSCVNHRKNCIPLSMTVHSAVEYDKVSPYLSSSTSMTHCSGVFSLAGISSERWKISMWLGMGISRATIVERRVDLPLKQTNNKQKSQIILRLGKGEGRRRERKRKGEGGKKERERGRRRGGRGERGEGGRERERERAVCVFLEGLAIKFSMQESHVNFPQSCLINFMRFLNY